MKKCITLIITATLLITCAASLCGCSGSISDVENAVSNTISNVTSKLENNVVTSTWNEVNKVETKADAATLNKAIKDFYAGVVSGTVNEDSAGYLVTAALPASNASVSEKKNAAKELTVFSAVEWQGMQNRFTDEYLSNFMYGNGNVVLKSDGNSSEFKPITLDTKLGDLMN